MKEFIQALMMVVIGYGVMWSLCWLLVTYAK